jgi:hypothetical protein
LKRLAVVCFGFIVIETCCYHRGLQKKRYLSCLI